MPVDPHQAPARLAKLGFASALLLGILLARPASQAATPDSLLKPGAVIAFAGGADVVGLLYSGHLETLLTTAYPRRNLTFRNFGWEGDTVYEQPRDVGFPPLKQHLEQAGVTVVFLQFGRAEALGDPGRAGEFARAYDQFIASLQTPGATLALVTPPPYEDGPGPLPKLSRKNAELAKYAAAIRELAATRGLPCIDLFARLSAPGEPDVRLTENGLTLTPAGQALAAESFARELGLKPLPAASQLEPGGSWTDPRVENLRQAIIAKNRLWFHYWRPQNWAFLGGDRVEQPSSRDHRNPKLRWFPAEMEKFLPLIQQKEKEIAMLALEIAGGAR